MEMERERQRERETERERDRQRETEREREFEDEQRAQDNVSGRLTVKRADQYGARSIKTTVLHYGDASIRLPLDPFRRMLKHTKPQRHLSA